MTYEFKNELTGYPNSVYSHMSQVTPDRNKHMQNGGLVSNDGPGADEYLYETVWIGGFFIPPLFSFPFWHTH